MTLDKVDRWGGTLILDTMREELKGLEDDLAKYLDGVRDPNRVHEEVPLFFVLLEDLEHLRKRVKKAQKQLDDAIGRKA